VSEIPVDGWSMPPKLAVVVPPEREPGWADAALWCVLLEAWGFHADRVALGAPIPPGVTTLVVPGAAGEPPATGPTTTVLVAGSSGGDSSPAGDVVAFGPSADDLARADAEDVADAAERALERAAPLGIVGLWRWPRGATCALVVDGDVDHPSGVDPECSRYVAPAIETAVRAGFDAYGIFVAGANVEAEPASFPPGAAGYYNHSYGHPYSHWDPRPWEALDDGEIADEIRRCAEALRRILGRSDEGIFRLPHFQLEAAGRTYAVLDELGYHADSSIGANVSITGGLPFHPALRQWSDRPADAACARSHPDPLARHALLQLPISTDPTDPAFRHGCCSYNTLGEGVRTRTADPSDYERILDEVLARSLARRGLAHLFIDPPDAGYGRLPGDGVDYAGAIERWMGRAAAIDDVAILTTSGLARWWLDREAAIGRTEARVDHGRLVVEVGDPPPGTSIAILAPRSAGGAWTRVPATAMAA
jgi:hypothetical protein